MGRSHLLQDLRSFGLMLDLYHLTMAYGFWKKGYYTHEAVFNLSYRKPPYPTPYAVAAGLALAMDILEHFRFTQDDIRYLGQLKGSDGNPLFDLSFLNYLQRMEFRCDVDAIPEGAVVFPHEPLLRVRGPLIQAQIVESALINVINFSTLIATKAARTVQAARGGEVIEFGLRRAQGIDGALTATRSAYIGGCSGTSNVLAGKYYGIPVKGTHAHSWIMMFEDELTAFREYADALPNNCIFLVDTYDTIEGVKNAIKVGLELRRSGKEMIGIRLDSGDLAALSIEARRLLDEAGLTNAIILASNEMDENRIADLLQQGARIDSWGVGTRLVTGYPKTALGGVYKLSAIREKEENWEYRIKLSEEKIKISNPGIQQVKRLTGSDGIPVADLIYDEYLPYSQKLYDSENDNIYDYKGLDGEDLLIPVFREGSRVYESPGLNAIRQFSLEQQALFQQVDLTRFRVGLEKHLHDEKAALVEKHRKLIDSGTTQKLR